MDWWYKSEKYKVNSENSDNLEEGIKTVLRQGNNLASANLYDDSKFFYVKTTNHFCLNYFLSQNGFEEIDEADDKSGLKLLYGEKI